MKNKAIFIDRYGVINSDEGHSYIYKITDFKFNEGVIDSLKLFFDNGYKIIIITNQGGISRGVYEHRDVLKINNLIEITAIKNGFEITDIYYCPHHDKVEKCLCLKPSPLNILKAIQKHNIDVESSYMIGDSEKDVEAGKSAGLKSIRVEKNKNLLPLCKEILKGKYE